MRPPSAFDVRQLPVEVMDPVGPGEIPDPEISKADISKENQTPEEGVYVFPASLEQIRYWTLNQLDSESTASNMAIAVVLEGTVVDSLVERSVRALVERHEALRTTFRMVDSQLSQVISEEPRFSFSVTDLRNLPEADRESAAEAAVEEHSHAHAVLAEGPMFFVRLIHLSDQRHYLAFTMHQIVCDGWSNGILVRDFADLYAAFSKNLVPSLPELPFQFADFTVWQQNWLQSEAAESALAFWRSHIRRDLPAVDLPTDQPRLPQKSYPGHIESSLLSPALTGKIKAYCRTHDATMHQVMLAAFEALIARYTNQREFLLGSTIANRTQPGMENVVGRFANPQVILADVNGDPSYAQLLDRVKLWSSESYAHQDLPFSRLMEAFQLDQAGATSQFLQVYFVYQKAFMQPHDGDGLRITPRPSVSGGVNFDLLVSVVERAEGPRLQMEYNTVIFRRERIRGLIDMYIRVLEAVIADDSLSVSRLPLVAPQQSAQDQGTQNAAGSVASSELANATNAAPAISIAEWLDRNANSLAEATAILEGEEKLSWIALRDLSLAFSSALLARGVASSNIVALRIESGPNTAAAAWALLRIGAVVLPISASAAPAEWLRITAGFKSSLALASTSFAPGVTAFEDLLDADPRPVSVPAPPPASTSTAWLGLTLQSDGTYAAVPSSHAQTLNQILAAAKALDLRPGDTTLSTATHSSADAWIDLLLPLVSGATSVSDSALHTEDLQSTLDRHRISHWFISPAGLLAAIQNGWSGDPRLNVVVRQGLLTASHLRRVFSTPMRLWALVSSPHVGGPLAFSRVLSENRPAFEALPGQSLAVLDEFSHPAPSGVIGELALAATEASTRSGYLARAQLAAESSAVNANRTGPPNFDLLDSVDRLVRLHGYRLRLGEVEEILIQNPAVADAAAAILPVGGAPTLVAYFLAFEPSEETTRSVRNHFQATAPGHLATAELIAVSALPHNADGSADFAQLPAPGAARPTEAPAEEYLAPRDELENSLVAIWEEVLGVRPIGVQTSFFKLGGYSLMIVRLFARINKALGTSLPITTIFNAPTVEQLADIVRGRAYYSSLVPVRTGGTKPPFFMLHSYLLYQGIPGVLGPDYPFYGLRELDTDAKDLTVDKRASLYLDAMRSIQPQGPYYIGGWCAAGPLVVETARQILASGESVGYLVLFDSWRPGYAAELAREQAGTAEMSLRARLDRKYRFHRNQLSPLSQSQRLRYVFSVVGNKLSSIRNRIYLKNWAFAEWFCRQFGLQLPHFMHNVSLTTLNSLKEYRGVEPYMGSMTLIRAKEAPYIPGAKEHCGWDAIVKGGVEVAWAPGDHESMFLEPHLQTVGNLMREGLEKSHAQS
jgi:non-ribosomal peptide synthetase component F/thioesterase domain-containing protein/acyl carrier protein